MKYCPYCGLDLPTDDILFCPECGKKLSEKGKQNTSESNPKKSPRERPKLHRKKHKAPPDVVQQPDSDLEDNFTELDDGYDGYYDDIIPSDDGGQQEGINEELLKKVLLIAAGVLLIISVCVAFLCLF